MSGRPPGNCGRQPELQPGTGDCLGLISTGTSPFDSSLLGVSADGTDAYFFTRDTLVPQDQNGKLVKIYDARALGGFPFSHRRRPARHPMSATGRARRPRRRPTINTVTGTRGNRLPARCRRQLRQKARPTACPSAPPPAPPRRADRSPQRRCRSDRPPDRCASSPRFRCACVAGLLAIAAPAHGERADRLLHHHQPRPRQAGGHPDLETSFTLDNPGEPEAAKNVIFNAPTGLFGNPNAIDQCTLSRLRPRQCPSNSQAGLITIHANYEGDPDDLLGTAPIYDLDPQADRDRALLPSSCPTLDIPIQIPVAVRTGGRLRPALHRPGHHPARPARRRRTDLLGLSRRSRATTPSASPKARPGNPAGCPGLADTSCIASPTAAAISVHPLTDNPTTCTGQPLTTTLEVQTYQDPGTSLPCAGSSYPATTGCEKETFKPVLFASPTTNETDSRLGPQHRAQRPAVRRASPLAFGDQVGDRDPARRASRSTPTPPTARAHCTDAQANFGSEGPANCPDNAKIGTFSIGSPTPQRAASKAPSTSANPSPATSTASS